MLAVQTSCAQVARYKLLHTVLYKILIDKMSVNCVAQGYFGGAALGPQMSVTSLKIISVS